MLEFPESLAKSTNLKIKILGLAGLVAILLLVLGLIFEPLRIEHQPVAWYERLSLLFLSFDEDGWFVGKNEGWLIIVGAMLARLVVLSAILLGVWTIFARQINSILLARRRGHVIVVGDTPPARALVAYLKAKGRDSRMSSRARIRSPIPLSRRRSRFPSPRCALENFASLRRAKRSVLDTGDIAANMALARAIRHDLGDHAPPISCNIESSHLADEFSELLGVQRDILIYDEARLAVRDTLARHPLYASADRQGAKRVHLLIVGFGHFGRVLLDEAIQDSIAGTLEKPSVTIIDRNAEALARLSSGTSRSMPWRPISPLSLSMWSMRPQRSPRSAEGHGTTAAPCPRRGGRRHRRSLSVFQATAPMSCWLWVCAIFAGAAGAFLRLSDACAGAEGGGSCFSMPTETASSILSIRSFRSG